MSTVIRSRPTSPESPRVAPPALLHDLFGRRAMAFPDRPAVVCGGTRLTYAELDLASNRLARRLRRAGVGRGDFVGLYLPRSADVYVAMLAALKAGATYVPLDPDYPADRVLYILRDCRARVLITDPDGPPCPEGFAGTSLTPADIDAGLDSDEPLPNRETGVTAADLCYVIYTSGTTGRPKGVEIEHRSACHLVRAEAEIFRVGPADRVFQGFSVAFDASVEEIWLAFNSGASLVVGTREMIRSGPGLAGHLTEAGVTVFSTVPTLLALMEDDLPTVRLLILGGEACPDRLVARWHRPGRRLVNTYGPTEATVIATYAECSPDRPVTIGRPVPGYSVHLLDERLRPVPRGTPGEIFIGGPGLARGYVGLAALTREKFVDGPAPAAGGPPPRLYRSGDLGRENLSGEIEFLGRVDTQVKLRGFRIELSEIESVLLEDPGVQSCAVALRDDGGVPHLVAYAVPRGGARLEPRAVLGSLRSRLPAYMIPSRLETLEALPTLPSGKVDRRGLPAPTSGPVVATEAGGTDVESAILRVWSAVFSPLSVSRHDDFFNDLGGHSLLAARAVSELRLCPGLADLSVIDLYDHPTVESLAAVVEGRRPSGSVGASPESVARARYRAPSGRAFVLCGVAQLAALYVIVGVFSLQWLAPYLVYSWLAERGVGLPASVSLALLALPAVYPVMLGVSVAAKWVVVGRYRAGEYPLWGVGYFRWWLAGSFQKIVPVSYMEGTPLLPWYYRLMGARVGENVHLGSSGVCAFDLLSVGADSSIGADTDVSGFAVEDGVLKVGPVTIGRRCAVGNRVSVRENARVGDGASLGDLSLLPARAAVPDGERWGGSPARRSGGEGPRAAAPASGRPSPVRRFAFGLIHAVGLLVFPLLVSSAIFPGVILMNVLNEYDPGYAYLAFAPVAAVSFVVLLCLEIAAVKWLLLGRVRPGTYDLHGGFYVRKWFVDQLLELSLDVIGPLYATLYLTPWYRLLGARLGRRAEVSTASFISPDLLSLGDEGFIADAVSLGAPHVEGGAVTIAEVRVGRRAFVGNSALLPPGSVVGDNALIGCLSAPPATTPGSEAPGSAWLGSPSVFLPQRQESRPFDDRLTYNPGLSLRLQRAAIEFFRVILPSTFFIILTSLLLSLCLTLDGEVSRTTLVLAFPLLYAAFGVAAALVTAGFKWVLMGRYVAGESPLWSAFVWRTELVTGLYDNLARLFLVDKLVGTPFLAWYLRLLGARVGKRAYLNSCEFTEFDLVRLGDDVALNDGCTVQTHLFEDRVMKMSAVVVGDRCSVGGDSVVLYDSEMKEGSSLDAMSLLMKGETLPRWTRWEGSPARASTR